MPDFSADGIPDTVWREPDGIEIVACGSATHAALLGRFWIEELAGIPVTVNTASEYRYRPPAMNGHTLVIPISQSGETADTLAALRLAKKKRQANARHSQRGRLYRSSRGGLCTLSVRGTGDSCRHNQGLYHSGSAARNDGDKARCAARTARHRARQSAGLRTRLRSASCNREHPLARQRAVEIARLLRDQSDAYFIGRGPDFPACTECSLKLKEISYIHSEAYAAGELKHGTLSLIERGTILAALATDPLYHAKTAGNIAEVRARGAVTRFSFVLPTLKMPRIRQIPYSRFRRSRRSSPAFRR